MMVAFLISGSLGYAADFVTNDALLKVENVTREIQEEEYSLDSGVGEYKSTILVTDNGKLNVNSKAINIDYFLSNTTADTGWRRCAINVQNGGEGVFEGENINITAKTDNDIAVGVHAWRDTGTAGSEMVER